MTPAARIQALSELLNDIEKTPRPADALTSAYFRSRRYIGSKDRGYIAQTLYDILRHHARLNWWLAKVGAQLTPRLQLVAYLLLVESKSAKEVEALFSGEKFAAMPLTDGEKAAAKNLQTHTIEHPSMSEDVAGECPAWAYEGLKARFGTRLQKELKAMLLSAPLDIRVNTLKAKRPEIMEQIRQAGFKAELCHYSPLGIRIEERPSLNALPILKQGLAEIQDEGSQMVAFLMDAKPGDRVVDFCAGAGGKTLAIAAAMNNKGKVVACDVLEGRLKRSSERFRRAGLNNVEIKPLTSESDPWVKRHKAGFDRVLVDAPCSGTGTWRRNPDARWKRLGPGFDDLLALQGKILASASRLVKPGGRLVYATCSLLAQENERQIEIFLAAHADFRLVKAGDILKPQITEADVLCPGDYLALTPAQHNTDGFFGAVMERNKIVPKPAE